MSVATNERRHPARPRVDGRVKVTGQARYAFEQPIEGVAYAAPVVATIAAGEIDAIDPAPALGAPRRARGHLARQRAQPRRDRRRRAAALPVRHRPLPRPDRRRGRRRDARGGARGRRRGAHRLRRRATTTSSCADDHPRLYKPDKVNPSFPTDTAQGDAEAAFAARRGPASTRPTPPPRIHNNPMEPHASARDLGGRRPAALRLDPGHLRRARARSPRCSGSTPSSVRVIAQHVGGGFGSKGTPRPQAVLAAIAARKVDGRPVKLRAHAAADVRAASATARRRSSASASAPTRDGTLTAIAHDAFEQTSTVREFAEQTARRTRMMYAAPDRLHHATGSSRSTSRRRRGCARPASARACSRSSPRSTSSRPRCGLDPIELRIRNEPDVDPEKGIPFSSRNLVACLREGAERFGWAERDRPAQRDGRWLIGTGVAASTYPAYRSPAKATARCERRRLRRARSPPPTSAPARAPCSPRSPPTRSASTPEQVRVEIGDSDFGARRVAGGSMGTASWGSAVVARLRGAARAGRGRGLASDTGDDVKAQNELSRHAFGAQFVEVAGRRRHRRGPRPARARRVRGRPRHQPEDRPLAVHRRHDHGPRDGAAGGERHGPRVRRLPQPRPRAVPRPRLRRHRGDRRASGSTRTTATSTRWAPRASARSASSAPRRRSPTRSSTPPACACASCRSGSTACSV